MDREINPRVRDLQSMTRLAESWTLHFFDVRVDFPVPEQSRGWLFFSYSFQSRNETTCFVFKNYFKTFSAQIMAPAWVNLVDTSMYDLWRQKVFV